MKIYGLTGGIACGKSTVSEILTELGAAVVDADKASRLVMKPGQNAYKEICKHFGHEVLSEDGQINRQVLGKIVFENAQQRTILESITHPAIRHEVTQQLLMASQIGKPIGVVEAALLVENGSYSNYNGLIVVSCRPELQLQRLMKRNGFTEEEAIARIDSQWPLSKKESVADWLIMNNFDRKHLKQETEIVWRALIDGV